MSLFPGITPEGLLQQAANREGFHKIPANPSEFLTQPEMRIIHALMTVHDQIVAAQLNGTLSHFESPVLTPPSLALIGTTLKEIADYYRKQGLLGPVDSKGLRRGRFAQANGSRTVLASGSGGYVTYEHTPFIASSLTSREPDQRIMYAEVTKHQPRSTPRQFKLHYRSDYPNPNFPQTGPLYNTLHHHTLIGLLSDDLSAAWFGTGIVPLLGSPALYFDRDGKFVPEQSVPPEQRVQQSFELGGILIYRRG